MKKHSKAPKPKAAMPKKPRREDTNQIAYRVMQETIRRSESMKDK